jgi:hypothetical protein
VAKKKTRLSLGNRNYSFLVHIQLNDKSRNLYLRHSKKYAMKKTILVLLCFISISFSAFSQTVDEVIQKYNTAMGGLDAFAKINTAKLTGTLGSQGQLLPLTIQIVNGKSMRTDVMANGKPVVNVYHDNSGWKINPFAGAPLATTVTGSELAGLKTQASLANNLMDYKNRGHEVELLGQEDVNGVKAYKIKLISKDDGKTTTYFISTVDHMLLKSIAKREVAGNEYDAESFYTDFRTINGLKFCYNFISKIQGRTLNEVKYTNVELNVAVDEKIFVKPQ